MVFGCLKVPALLVCESFWFRLSAIKGASLSLDLPRPISLGLLAVVWILGLLCFILPPTIHALCQAACLVLALLSCLAYPLQRLVMPCL